MEVLNGEGGTTIQRGVIEHNCKVELGGEDSELNLAEGTDLLFFDDPDYKDFTITAAGSGFEIEIQVKKNSIIEAQNFTATIDGAEEAEAQFEDNFCLRLYGDLLLSMSLEGDEGGDVQFKQFDLDSVVRPEPFRAHEFTDGTDCGGSPNINVDGDITLSVGDPLNEVAGDAEIQIEVGNHLKAGGDISIEGHGEKIQLQTKKNVTLEAGTDADDDITLSALGDFSEVQAEENNKYTAGGDILLETGEAGKLEVKKLSDFDAGAGAGTITIDPGTGTFCIIESFDGIADGTDLWSAGGAITTTGCLLF